MLVRARLGLVSLTLALACGDDGSPIDGSDGSTAADASTGAATNDPATSAPSSGTGSAETAEATGSTDGESTSGGPPPGGTPGCGSDFGPVEGTVETMVGATIREYLLVVPEGYDPSTPMPVVFAWHGLGGTSELARLYFQIEAAADGRAIFVYPQGVPQELVGGQTGWDTTAAGADVQFFDTMLEEVSQNLCVDPERVFSTGHSFGGYMTNALGCFRGSVLRAIGPVSGGPPFGACEPETVAAWLAHGTGDQVVPFSQGESARDSLLGRNGCAETSTAVDPAPCAAYDGCADGTPVVWCAHDETELQGHAWPRFAGAAIWAFFEGLPPKP
jgi:polyhydroxybutyrate depolymerase